LITSVQNPRVKAASRLRDSRGRREQGRIIIDGVREIGRALAAGLEVLELYYFSELSKDDDSQQLLAQARDAGAELIEVTPHVMEKLAFGQRVEGLVAVARPPKRNLSDLTLADDALIVVIEGVEKPGNIGAILRTADAAGVAAMIVTDGATDLYNPNAIRASLGAIFSVPLYAASGNEMLEWLRRQQFRMIAARVEASADYTQADFRGRVALILGSEAHGLSALWQASDVVGIRLPMLGVVDSLNVSATAAVLLYEALRQRSSS
jgi:TrmH family RNA methyltransferase